MAAGPNDIEAAFVLRDDVTKVLKSIDANVTKSMGKLADTGKKPLAVFDKMSFSFYALRRAAQVFFNVFKENEDFKEFTSSLHEFIANRVDFSWLKDISKELGSSNAESQMQKIIDKSDELRTVFAASFKQDESEIDENHFGLMRGAIKKQLFELEKQADILRRAKDIQEKFSQTPISSTDLLQLDTLGPDTEQGKAYQKLIDERYKVPILEWSQALEIAKKDSEDLYKTWQAPLLVEDNFQKIDEDIEKFSKTVRELQTHTEFSKGWEDATYELGNEFNRMGDMAQRFAKETHATISNDLFAALKGDEISFAQFTTHIFDSVLHQITDSIAASLLSGGGSLFGSLFGGSSNSGNTGGVWSLINGRQSSGFNFDFGKGAVDVPMHGDGGHFNKPHLAVVGDKPEMIIPDSKMPAFLARAGKSNVGTVIVNLNAVDAKSGVAFLSTPHAQRAIGDAMIRANANRYDVRNSN